MSDAWVTTFAEHGLHLTWQGRQWRGPCPFHRGSNPTALAVTPEYGFKCFSCGERGGLARFRKLLGAAPLPDAVLPAPSPEPVRIVRPLRPLDAAHPYLSTRGIHEATARLFGMGVFTGAPPFGNRVVTPIHDGLGQLVGHLGRAIDDAISPRYIVQRGTRRSRLLFNLHGVTRSGASTVILVEGVFDVLALHQHGMANAVASLGCDVSKAQRDLLAPFDRVVILFDADAAGRRAALTLRRQLRGAVIARLPSDDPATVNGDLLRHVIATAQ